MTTGPADSGASARPPLGPVTKTLYGMGYMGLYLKAQLFGLLLLFYNQLEGLDSRLVSLAISASVFIEALWDPIVGQLSDVTSTRWGRRHPYMYAAVIPCAVCFALLFMPPRGWPQPALFLYLLLLVIAARIFEDLQDIPYFALMPELTSDFDERTNVQSYRYLLGPIVGGGLATLLGFGVFLRGTKSEPFGQLNQAGYAPYAIAMAALGAATMLAAALGTQRFAPHLHRPHPLHGLAATAREIGAALSNRNFMAFAGFAVASGLGAGVGSGLTSYFYTYFWELPSSAFLLLQLLPLGGAILGVLVAPIASRTWGKKPTSLTAMLGAIVVGAAPVAARLAGLMPPDGSPWVLRILVGAALVGATLTAIWAVVLSSMLADITEEIQVKTGRRTEGLLFSFEKLLQSLSVSFSALIPGLVIAAVGFPAHARPGHVKPEVLVHLAMLYLPITVIFGLLGVAVMLFYRIDKQRHGEHLRQVADASAAPGAVGAEIAAD